MNGQESSITIASAVYIFFVSSINNNFISSGNIFNILRSPSFVLIFITGMALILITADLDLSVGFSVVVLALVWWSFSLFSNSFRSPRRCTRALESITIRPFMNPMSKP
ncbi:hypothetical protein EXM22_17105 [Oceanispirochaeta crateris]|uniref:Uncharacterized protein n=1 Tax=Oceanispirochaeta crateris TaxID=2518645 RepID=A0A5C1QQ33_9SPIO|nr:hypothetical protein [Oceanispirochaeta crateris]QEN09617.1 hypothetical protein EXM22_17105 [Oceanispirochaeta crateris]